MSSEEKPGAALPVHAKDNPNVDAEGAPTKSALKKAAKEAEKAAKKAAAKEKEAAQRAAQQAAADEDKAVDNYGNISKAKEADAVKLKDLTDEYANKTVTFFARVENTRSQSAKLGFLTLREQGYTIQAVLAAAGDDVSKQMVKWALQTPVNSIFRVTGLVKKVDAPIASATISGLEVAVTRVYEVSRAVDFLPMAVRDAEKPIPESGIVDPEDKSPPVPMHIRLDNRVIDLQADINQAIFTISSAVEVLFTEYMFKHGSRKFNTPKLVGAATEGGAGVFAVTNYFGKTAYLAQSPQFYKQMLIAADCESVFEIGPVFRAENSNTHRHLTEFTGLDFEMVFNNHYHEVLSFGENLIVHILTTLQKEYAREIATIQRIYPRAGDFRIKDNKALRLKYADGIALLKEAGVDTSEQDRFETDLSTAMEKQLGKIIREKYDTDFYVLDEFPMAVRPFYTKAHPTDPNLSNSYDFFMRGEEIMSGAQRINEASELEQSMRAKGVDPNAEGFKDYIDAFRQGCRPHAGGGLGLNRIVQFFLGLDNVRQATPFPRDPQRLRP
ncbi:aspartate-tRNA(Asn) ligase [Cyphellophora europaea CBS 101466]|uniref:Probable aspartate--tRNA ligase, cytoplasmic n=1 Tax=Cyphellophora europaea (strain CBS 101466) TaxID=1220924 RepID=W2RKM1_CYPE1|nr:aspartate-tRNA(Asn) ligase [Cyphellophora europaea CBS 101466]ETN36279.1 aspartate-tRNA(Asn) ligase [Cyphellophora europaea CBS 101466]